VPQMLGRPSPRPTLARGFIDLYDSNTSQCSANSPHRRTCSVATADRPGFIDSVRRVVRAVSERTAGTQGHDGQRAVNWPCHNDLGAVM